MPLSVETVLLFVVIALLIWKEFTAHRSVREVRKMSAQIVTAYQAEIGVQRQDNKDSQVLVAAILKNAEDERQRFFGLMSDMTDRFMTRSLQDFALFSRSVKHEPPAPQRVSNQDEFENEMRVALSQRGFSQEQIDTALRKAGQVLNPDDTEGTVEQLAREIRDKSAEKWALEQLEGIISGTGGNTRTATEPAGINS